MQAILTRYHGPTNSRGSRISARADAGRISVPYDHALNVEGNHRAAMHAFREKVGWNDPHYSPMVGGQIPSGDYVWVFVIDPS